MFIFRLLITTSSPYLLNIQLLEMKMKKKIERRICNIHRETYPALCVQEAQITKRALRYWRLLSRRRSPKRGEEGKPVRAQRRTRRELASLVCAVIRRAAAESRQEVAVLAAARQGSLILRRCGPVFFSSFQVASLGFAADLVLPRIQFDCA